MGREVLLAIVLLHQTVNSASIGSNQSSCYTFAQCDSESTANSTCYNWWDHKRFYWCDYERPIKPKTHFLSFLFPKEKRFRKMERMCGYSKQLVGCYQILYGAEYWQHKLQLDGYSF